MTLPTTSGHDDSRAIRRDANLAMCVAGLMALQATLGLFFRAQYQDAEWIRATWLGNDWVTLLLAVPLLARAARLAARGSRRARVVMIGGLVYAVYNNAYYLFGAALNVFFPLYVALCLLSTLALLRSVRAVDRSWPPATTPGRSIRAVGAYFVCVGTGLAVVWLVLWADFVFLGHAPPIETEAFKLVAALDLTLMIPILLFSGALLWLRRLSGCWIGAAAGIQASMYLAVLSVNSALAVRSGNVEAPGEVPIWGLLAVLTAAAARQLLRQIPGPNRDLHAA